MRKEKRRGGKQSLVLAHAIPYRLHNTLARVHNPTFVLTRIIPCRDPLHSFLFSTYTRAYNGRDWLWETHDHEIKRKEDPTLGPVCLGICRNIVDQEARANEEDDFKEILLARVSFLY